MKRLSALSRYWFGSLLHSLRRQFAFALLVLTLLIMAYGATALYALHRASDATRELAERRLTRLQAAQNLLWQTLSATRSADQLQAVTGSSEMRTRYADLVKQLNQVDQLVERLNVGDNTLEVLDLQYADQLFISTVNTLVQQRGMLARDQQAFELAYQFSLSALQQRRGLTAQRERAILLLASTAHDEATVQQLRTDITRLPGWVAPWRNASLDPYALRLIQLKRIGIIARLEDALHQQAFKMMDSARAQSDYFTADYRRAVNGLADNVRRQQLWVLALLIGTLLVAWTIGYLFLGRHVLGRLSIVSRHLRLDSSHDEISRLPVSGHDEIASMARAVERFLDDRNQLHRARVSLQESESRLAAIIQYAADGFVIVQDGAIRQLNPAAERLLGWQIGEVPRLDLALSGAPTDTPLHADTQAYRPDGAAVPVEVSISDVTLASGAKVSILVVRDATVRREAERQLTAARDAAESARSAQATFLANMSHEFRTPLNAILGYAQILKRDEQLSERNRRGLGTIEQSGEHLLMLVNDILDLAQIEAGRLELFPSQIDLNSFLSVMADIIVVKTEQKSLMFKCDWQTGLPGMVEVDERRLRQVLLNLLGNAVKFTVRGHVTLRVRWHALDDAQGVLRFEIEDSGVGIAADQLQHIFERFIQVGESRARLSGSGLGLAISRHLLLLMASQLEVSSELGAGSRFWFELKLPYGEQGVVAQRVLPVVGYQGYKRKILVVDDGEGNRSMLEAMLAELGFEVLVAGDGAAGVALARSCLPHLIIMDAMMPVLDGPSAVSQIRAIPELSQIPIVMVSADVTHDNQQAAARAGVDAFVSKPVRQDELTQQIGRLLALDWEYFTKPPQIISPAILHAPPQEELQVLYRLAQLGDMLQLRAHADELASRDSQYRAFAEQLLRLAAELRSKAILHMIEQCIEAARI